LNIYGNDATNYASFAIQINVFVVLISNNIKLFSFEFKATNVKAFRCPLKYIFTNSVKWNVNEIQEKQTIFIT
jgi:hypothetical protein